MKPFDLEAAKRGEPIVTRDGRKARFVAHVPEAYEAYSVIIFIDGSRAPVHYSARGTYTKEAHVCDLFMYTPPMRSINGHEYPEPVREPLELGQCYFVPQLICSNTVAVLHWDNYTYDNSLLKLGLIHLTRESAEAHLRAIILAGGGEV